MLAGTVAWTGAEAVNVTLVELLTATLSKVAVFSVVVLCESTTSPISTLVVIEIVTAAPTCVHVVPSGERYAEIDVPLRISLSQ